MVPSSCPSLSRISGVTDEVGNSSVLWQPCSSNCASTMAVSSSAWSPAGMQITGAPLWLQFGNRCGSVFWGRSAVSLLVFGQLGNQFGRAQQQVVAARVVESAAVTVLLHHAERGQQNHLIEVDQWPLGEEAIGDAMGLVLVHGQHALVELCLRRELGILPQENVQKAQLRHVPAHHDEARGKWRGEHQSRPAPQQGPEDSRGQKGQRGDAGARSV